MAKNTNKTKLSTESVEAFLNTVEHEKKRQDCFKILEIMKSITKAAPKMWGKSIIGFGSYHYKYESGREGDWFLTGFSPRKQNLTIYLMTGFNDPLMEDLGKYKTGKSCLYIKQLEDIDTVLLKQLIINSIKKLGKMYDLLL